LNVAALAPAANMARTTKKVAAAEDAIDA
jgi:hypothetical protein